MKMKQLLRIAPVALGITALCPQLARAEKDPYAPAEEKRAGERHLLTDWGAEALIGGGVTNFTDRDINNITDPGGSWTARLVVGSRKLLGFEAAYTGTINNIQTIGLDPDALLMSNGFEGLLRVNFTNTAIQPYVVAGAGWSHFNIINEDFNSSAVLDSDDVLELPIGAGLAYMYKGLVLDGRFTFRPTFDEDLVRNPDAPNSDLNGLESWDVSARIGFEF